MVSVGIDFGTTNSVAARWTGGHAEALDIDSAPGEWALHGFSRVMPSVFARDNAGEATFGWAAKRSQTRPFEAVKRLFATQQEHVTDDAGVTLAVEEVATMLFGEIKRGANASGVSVDQAVVTVPANSRGLARHRTKICAGMAGIEVLTLLNEPTAAAMAYAIDDPGDRQVLVFDWGGGTLDVTILRSVHGVFIEQASKGLPTSGGIDFDSKLAQLIRECSTDSDTWNDVERRTFMRNIELAKIELSQRTETEIQLPRGETRQITRRMFANAVGPLVAEAERPLRQCLADIAGGPADIDAIVMVGGTCQIPMVREFVAEILDREPVQTIDPMTAVGEGAAVAAAILTGELDTADFFVATEHALGASLVDHIDHERGQMHHVFGEIIPRNHKLPVERKVEDLYPIRPEQTHVTLEVLEGDPSQPIDHPDTVMIAQFDIPLRDISPNNADKAFAVTYAYDVDGILHIAVHDGVAGTLLASHEVGFGISEDKREMVRLSKRARETVETRRHTTSNASAPEDAEAAMLLERAHVKVIPFLDEDDAPVVRIAAQRLQEADSETREEAKAALRAALAPYPYLY